jgi:hypothetical protein
MKALLLATLLVGAALPSTGCIVHSRDRHGHSHQQAKRGGCGPAHHWNGRACVHNGKAKGHYK